MFVDQSVAWAYTILKHGGGKAVYIHYLCYHALLTYTSIAAVHLQTKVEKRNMAIAALVQEATKAPSHGHHHAKGQLRPLHVMDFKNEDLQEVDLTEAAVLAEEGSQHFQAGLATVVGSGSGAQ